MGRKNYKDNGSYMVDYKVQYDYFLNRLMSLAVSCYIWENLPDSIDERFMEITLMRKSFALFFKDNELDKHLCLPATIGGKLDVYDNPTDRTAYSNNGYMWKGDENNSVIIYDNYMRTPVLPLLQMFAKKLTNIEITKDINLHGQKTPFLITCNENQRLTMENLYLNYSSGVPVIYGSKEIDTKGINVFPTLAPYLADKLRSEKMAQLYEAFEYLGIGAVGLEKKERLITAEVETSQSSVNAQRQSRTKAREQACEYINRMFGLNVKVRFNEAITDVAEKFAKETLGEKVGDSGE